MPRGSLYARGMTVREIQGHVAELYGTELPTSSAGSPTPSLTRSGSGRTGRQDLFRQIGIIRKSA
jgi:hypothetical protein